MLDEPDTLDLTTVDTEREAASGAVSDMEVLSGPVQEAVSTINNAGNPINLMDSFSSTLEIFNSIVEKIATVRYHAMRQFKMNMDSPNCQIHPYAQAAWTVFGSISKVRLPHFFDDKIRSTLLMIIDQTNRDNDVGSLLTKMNEAYTFLTQAELRDIKSMKTVVACICKQTLECSYFIQRIPNFVSQFVFAGTYVNEIIS